MSRHVVAREERGPGIVGEFLVDQFAESPARIAGAQDLGVLVLGLQVAVEELDEAAMGIDDGLRRGDVVLGSLAAGELGGLVAVAFVFGLPLLRGKDGTARHQSDVAVFRGAVLDQSVAPIAEDVFDRQLERLGCAHHAGELVVENLRGVLRCSLTTECHLDGVPRLIERGLKCSIHVLNDLVELLSADHHSGTAPLQDRDASAVLRHQDVIVPAGGGLEIAIGRDAAAEEIGETAGSVFSGVDQFVEQSHGLSFFRKQGADGIEIHRIYPLAICVGGGGERNPKGVAFFRGSDPDHHVELLAAPFGEGDLGRPLGIVEGGADAVSEPSQGVAIADDEAGTARDGLGVDQENAGFIHGKRRRGVLPDGTEERLAFAPKPLVKAHYGTSASESTVDRGPIETLSPGLRRQ